jgi:uncharacterized membrane protein HdeD (DUF308 family)
MKNLGVISIIVGLILFFIPAIPDALIKFIGIVAILLGLFAIVYPEKASEYLNKIDFFSKKNIEPDKQENTEE